MTVVETTIFTHLFCNALSTASTRQDLIPTAKHLLTTPVYYRYILLTIINGPLTRYAKLRVVHAPGIPGMSSSPQQVRDPDMHHGTCATHVPWCMPGSLTSDFLWSRWRGKRYRHSRRIRNLHFCVSGKRPMHMLYSTLFLSVALKAL